MPELPVIVFDVNETLLDLEILAPTFERIFGSRSVLRLWFADLIPHSEAQTLARVYVPFGDVGSAVLRMIAAAQGVRVSPTDRAELSEKFTSMPPHAEVPQVLRKLRK
jgi:2-haloacid dehalogenase